MKCLEWQRKIPTSPGLATRAHPLHPLREMERVTKFRVSWIESGEVLKTMKIAIISDLHDNLPYLTAFLALAKKEKITELLICGDVGSLETLETIPKKQFKKIYFVFGNADNFSPDDVPSYIINLGESAIIEIDSKKIGLCHEPYKIEKLIADKPEIIFYGHTHKPWVEIKDKIMLVNPGTLGGVFMPSTFAAWNLSRPAPELIRTELLNK